MEQRNHRRVKQGRVKSNKMDKTIVVVTETRVPHPVYAKIVRKSVRFKAHDEKNECGIGDLVRIAAKEEVMMVTGVNTTANTLSAVRGYGATTKQSAGQDEQLIIIGNAALEGADKPTARFTNRSRCGNYMQIFTATVEVSGGMITTTSPSGRSSTPRRTAPAQTRRPQRSAPSGGSSSTPAIRPNRRTSATPSSPATDPSRRAPRCAATARTWRSTSHSSSSCRCRRT